MKSQTDALEYNVPKWLKHFGIDAFQTGSEWNAKCPIHKDTDPSFHVAETTGIWYCLAGETKVLTLEGEIEISKLTGIKTKILTAGSRWVDVEFYSFGAQPLMKLELTRNQVTKTIFATPEHEWIIKGRQARARTVNLIPGQALQSVFPLTRESFNLDPNGIRHGIIFGDGTVSKRGYASVDLHGTKIHELSCHFDKSRLSKVSSHPGTGKPYQRVNCGRLSFNPKLFPGEMPEDYLLGFLAGWLATDGHIAKDGTVMLHSSSKEKLEYARTIATKLGIWTYGITCQDRLGIDGRYSNIYRIHFITSSLKDPFFIRPSMADRFRRQTKKYDRLCWRVKSVEETDRQEEVFCCVVPGTHCFALEDNILTGNCFGCAQGGSLADLTQSLLTLSGRKEAHTWLKQNGFTTESQIKGSEIEIITKDSVPTQSRFTPCAGMKFKRLSDWPESAKAYLKLRGITSNQVVNWNLGYAIDGRLANRIIFPAMNEDYSLQGYTARSWDGSTPKYLTPHPRENPDHSVMFGELNWPGNEAGQRKAFDVVLCEGAINALAIERVAGAPHIAALGGSPLSSLDPKTNKYSVTSSILVALAKLSGFGTVYVATDPDRAGEKVRVAISVLNRWTKVKEIVFPSGTDAASIEHGHLHNILKSVGL